MVSSGLRCLYRFLQALLHCDRKHWTVLEELFIHQNYMIYEEESISLHMGQALGLLKWTLDGVEIIWII